MCVGSLSASALFFFRFSASVPGTTFCSLFGLPLFCSGALLCAVLLRLARQLRCGSDSLRFSTSELFRCSGRFLLRNPQLTGLRKIRDRGQNAFPQVLPITGGSRTMPAATSSLCTFDSSRKTDGANMVFPKYWRIPEHGRNSVPQSILAVPGAWQNAVPRVWRSRSMAGGSLHKCLTTRKKQLVTNAKEKSTAGTIGKKEQVYSAIMGSFPKGGNTGSNSLYLAAVGMYAKFSCSGM